MADSKVYIKSILWILLSGLIFLEVSAQSDGVWESYTSSSWVREIEFFEDSIQVATIGGWLKIDPVTLGMKKITNVDGLGTSNLFDIVKDNQGNVWIAGAGRLIKYRNGQYTPYLFYDNDNNLLEIYKIADDGDFLWIGTSTGLALFSKIEDGGQIEDFYFRFGSLNPNPQVYDILLDGDMIYLGTSDGLAISDRSDPSRLKSFANWITFNSLTTAELAGDSVRVLTKYDNAIVLGTSRSAVVLTIGASDTTFSQLPLSAMDRVNDISNNYDTLYIFSDSGVYRYFDGTTEGYSFASSTPGYKFDEGLMIGDELWVGVNDRGLYYDDDPGLQRYPDGGLPGVEITALSSNHFGLIGGSFADKDVAWFDDSIWVGADVASFVQFGVGAGSDGIAVDEYGNLWAGTKGNGMMLVTADTVVNFDEKNSALKGVVENPQYVVTNAMVTGDGYLFVSNYRAADGNPVAVCDLTDYENWTSFGDEDGIMDDLTNSIDYYDGTIAIGTENTGIYYYYCGGDPFDDRDDSVAHYREDNTLLGSNNVNTVRFDNSGELWAGTKYGLSRYDYGIDRFVNIVLPQEFGPAVNAIAFDRRNNVWIGTRSGLAFLNRVTGEFTIYDILNSGIPDNNVTALTIDYASGDIWIGTSNGMARFRTYLGTPATAIDQVEAYPNPFYIVSGDETVSFNYAENASVKIFTVNGELVKEMDINIPWDGTNGSGRPVVSGVYLALLRTDDGKIGKAKIFLIRK